MIWGLRIFAGLVLVGMLTVTTVASLDRGVFDAGAELWPDPWFKATLADAYFGFLTVFPLDRLQGSRTGEATPLARAPADTR